MPLREAGDNDCTYVTREQLRAMQTIIYQAGATFVDLHATEQHRAHIRSAEPVLADQLLLLSGYPAQAIALTAMELRHAVKTVDLLLWRMDEGL